ncbi:MAG: PIN domain nuclease [Coriobacteriia bacterium]|nr:PIN domain nuclease [Coriobacteriia bacterium]
MIVQLSRFVFATLGALAGLAVRGLIDWTQQYGFPEYAVIILFVILGTSIGFIFGGIIGRELQRGYLFIEEYLVRLSVSDLILGTAGLLVGLVFALIFSFPIRLLQPPGVAIAGQVGMFIVLGYSGVRITMLKRRDFARVVPQLASKQQEPDLAMKVLDTSAVIDGRFAELVRIGVVEGAVRVPGFVLAELQTLADSADDTRRARGRRGLDLLATMRGGERPVEVFDADYPEIPDVDAKLIQLGKDSGCRIVTVDYNLTQVARVQNVDVLNINDIAASLRPNHLPGENLRLHVVREGKEADQGVGYLDDGTMVVIQGGRPLVGTDVDTVVTSVLQTSGGRMIFARLKAAP